MLTTDNRGISWPRSTTIVTISQDHKVSLNPDLDLDQLKGLPLWVLYTIREMVNTAIYDVEHKSA
jgi:hypothetical protein